MNDRIAIVAVMAVLCGLTLTRSQEASAQTHNEPRTGGTRAAAAGILMRGGDTVSLIATLPWWRIEDSRPPDPAQLESPILTACDLWLGFPFATMDVQSLTVRLAAAQQASRIELIADRIKVMDASEFNEIDLATPQEPQAPSRPWLSALLALLGGLVAAVSALRYLLA